MRIIRAAAMASSLLTLWACAPEPTGPPPPPPGALPAGKPIGSAAIEGRVVFDGPPPARRPIRMSSEASCHKPGSSPLSEDLIVSADGGLKNAYVHIISGLGERVFAPPEAPAVMDQSGCLFVPHLLDVQANQPIEFANGDPVVHNVRAAAEKNRSFNVSMPGNGKRIRRFFSEPEVVKIRCDIHAWMSAFVAVESHPFHQVTGEDGSFSLRGLPAGSYEVEVWHERLGTQKRQVQLGEGESRKVEIAFKPRSAS
jgi:plastocyanin